VIIDLEKARTGLREFIRGREDFVYERPGDGKTCMYTWDGQPSCLVGQYLHHIGVPIDVLAEHNEDQIDDPGILATLDDVGFEIEEEAVGWLYHAQHQQDIGRTWGAAVAFADSKVVADDEEEEVA
jgi:hypothetical protein